MKSFSELIGKEPSKNKIKKALEKASGDLKTDRAKYLNHVAMNKASQVNDNQFIEK